MLKEAKKFVQDLEEMLNRLSQEFNKSVEELDAKFTDWYDNGGKDFDLGGGPSSFEAFERNCRYDLEDEAEQAAYDVIYENMRNYASRHGYDLQEWEIDQIIEGVEEDGGSVLECSDETLRDSLDDWIANNQK